MPEAILRVVEHPAAEDAMANALSSEAYNQLVGPALLEFSEANRFSEDKFNTLVLITAFAYHLGWGDGRSEAEGSH